MQALLEDFKEKARSFITQVDDLTMFVQCPGDETSLVLKMLADLDAANEIDRFLSFANPFTDAGSYVSTLRKDLAERVRLANVVREKTEELPFPTIPSESRRGGGPANQLVELLTDAKTLLELPNGQRLVWAMTPTEITNRRAWEQLLQELLDRPRVEPWMHEVRMFIRVDRELPAELAKIPRQRLQPFVFGPKEVNDGLQQQATNPATPEADRMQALLMITMMDAAQAKASEVQKNSATLREYFTRVNEPIYLAMTIDAEGTLERMKGRLPEAQKKYEEAIAPASASASPVVLRQVIQHLADVTWETNQWEDTAEYHQLVADLAMAMGDADGRVDALIKRANALEKINQPKSAIPIWEEVFTLGHTIEELRPQITPSLHHLRRLYQATGQRDKVAEVERELAR